MRYKPTYGDKQREAAAQKRNAQAAKLLHKNFSPEQMSENVITKAPLHQKHTSENRASK